MVDANAAASSELPAQGKQVSPDQICCSAYCRPPSQVPPAGTTLPGAAPHGHGHICDCGLRVSPIPKPPFTLRAAALLYSTGSCQVGAVGTSAKPSGVSSSRRLLK